MSSAGAGSDRQSRLRAMGRAFVNRNYRLFFVGQGVSLVGTWMTRLATGWLVFRLGGAAAPWLLGFVSFAGLAPTSFLGLVQGAAVPQPVSGPAAPTSNSLMKRRQ